LQEATRLEEDRKAFRIWLMRHDAVRAKREEKKKKKKKKKKISRKSKEFRGVALRDLRIGVR
jgi:hypothetical protein